MNQQRHNLLLLLAALLAFTAMFVGISLYVQRNRPSVVSQAASETVHVELYPNRIMYPPGTSFEITPVLVSNQYKEAVGYIQISLNFDPSALGFVSLTDAHIDKHFVMLSNIDIGKINQTGNLVLMVGLSDPHSLPDSSIQLPTLTFQLQKEGKSTIRINDNSSQVVFFDQKTASLQTRGADVVSGVNEKNQEASASGKTQEASSSAELQPSASPSEFP